MKLSTALNIMLSGSSYGVVTSEATSMKDTVGSGCQNNVQFSSKFMTDSGEECNTCMLCDGSHLSDVFKPKSKGVCVDCSAVEDTCNIFSITTKFDSEWIMKFVSLAPSSMPSESDPRVVIIEGSTDAGTWVELYNIEDNILFKTRTESTELLLSNNDTEYKYYRITFKPKDNMSKYYLGHYGLIPSYTKTCTSNIHLAITGEYVRPYETLAPTEAPTSSPTTVPTDTPGFEMTTSNIKTAVDLWTSDRSSALATYGHISTWDVSRATNMDSLFKNKSTFNDDLSEWNTAAVTKMTNLFAYNKVFNGDLSKWNTSEVTDMYGVFYRADAFNSDLSKWNTNKVRTLMSMFYACYKFNSDLSQWDTTNVTSMYATFGHAEMFNVDLSKWNIAKVTTMYHMFYYAKKFNQSLCWDTSGIATHQMFLQCPTQSAKCDV